jgi:hypothetical protein
MAGSVRAPLRRARGDDRRSVCSGARTVTLAEGHDAAAERALMAETVALDRLSEIFPCETENSMRVAGYLYRCRRSRNQTTIQGNSAPSRRIVG